MSDIITNTTNTNDCKVFKVYLSKYTATNISSSNFVINNSTVNGINVTNALNNLQNSKLDKGSFVGTAQDLYDYFDGKNIAQDDLINDLSSEIAYENVRNDSQDSRLENLEGINYTWSPTNRTLTLFDRVGNQLSQISLISLDNEGTDLRYNSTTLSLELYNTDNELLDSIPVSSFIGSVGTQLQLNSNQLQLKDSQGNILSTVSFVVSNIQGLQTALDGKLEKGTYTGTAQDLKKDIDGIQIGGRNYYPDGDFSKGINHYVGGNNVKTSGVLSIDFDGNAIPWNGSKCFSIFTDTAGDTYAIVSSIAKVDAGDYMLSFYYKSAGAINRNSSYLYINGIPYDLDFSITNDSQWHKVELPIGLGSKSDIQFRIGFDCNAPAWINVTRIKLEKGNKATDWTPAPEDIQDRLQNVTGNIGVGKTDISATEKLDVNGNVKATSFIKDGGTSTQILMADGSIIEKSTIVNGYTLPTASATVLGGVKIGSGISIDGNGVISANTSYTAGTNITISNNQISVVPSPTFSGNVTASGFYESSLRELKENILPFKLSGLDLISKLDIVTYDRIDKSSINKIGIIADDSPEEFLSENKDAVDLYKTVFIQAKAIQELNAKNDKLREELQNIRELILTKLNN